MESRRNDVTPAARGSIYVELAVTGRWALSVLTEGWSPKEVQALLADEPEARETLFAEAERRVLAQPDDVKRLTSDMRIEPLRAKGAA